MMVWYQMISYLYINAIQMFLGIYFITELLNLKNNNRKAVLPILFCSVFVTAMDSLSLTQFWEIGIQMAILAGIAYYLFRTELRLYIFLAFFYSVLIAFWEFIISTGLAVLFQSTKFILHTTIEYMAAVWLVRLLMVLVAVLNKDKVRLASIVSVLSLFGVVTISEQTVIPISDDQLTTWLILVLVMIMSILLFHMNRQYEMEKETTQLKAKQAELLERDYQRLNASYSVNAKLFHDLHNHIEILHRFLVQGKSEDALHYLEDFGAPMQEIVQKIWTGDEAIDYLINSKMALAEQRHIQTKINIEFPSHTNIRSADLTAILGNLLDNALEATMFFSDNPHIINLTIRRINEMLIIKVENDCEKSPFDNHGDLQSNKPDSSLHGWGLESIRTAAGHYDGTIETTYTRNIFCAVVTLSYK